MTKAHMMTGGRYPVLRSLGILYLVGAVAALCYGIYYTFWAFFASPGTASERFQLGLQTFAVTFFGVVTILAVAELIKLVIDIEHNTRVAARNGHTTIAATDATIIATGPDGYTNRLAALDEESAEAALLRGH
jgi:hypothetical protein